MAWEDLLSGIYSFNNASDIINNARAGAQAQATEGEYKAKEVADNTLRAGGKLITSFIQSGIVIDQGPKTLLQQVYNQGQTDIDRITVNANNASANTVREARTRALQTLAKSVGSSGVLDSLGSTIGSLFGTGDSDGTAFALNDAGFGNSAYDMLSASDNGASGISSFFGSL